MTGNRSGYQYVILFRKYFNDLQAFDLDTVTAHTAGHTHTFEYPGSIGRVTD